MNREQILAELGNFAKSGAKFVTEMGADPGTVAFEAMVGEDGKVECNIHLMHMLDAEGKNALVNKLFNSDRAWAIITDGKTVGLKYVYVDGEEKLAHGAGKIPQVGDVILAYYDKHGIEFMETADLVRDGDKVTGIGEWRIVHAIYE